MEIYLFMYNMRIYNNFISEGKVMIFTLLDKMEKKEKLYWPLV